MIIKNILKVEGLFFFIAAITFYFLQGYNWLIFLILLLAPDLFMLGYLKNSKIGALIYNIGHTYTLPLFLLLIGLAFNYSAIFPFVLIWIAHIGMDRMQGYGLKLPTGFRHTHLGEIGKKMKKD